MPKDYITREGQATTIDVYGNLTTLGSDTAPGTPKVPPTAKKLLGVIIACASTHATAGIASGIVRLEGAGLKNGPETIATGSASVPIATGGDSYMPPTFVALGVSVVPNQNIVISAQFVNEDIGGMSFGVSLVFEI